MTAPPANRYASDTPRTPGERPAADTGAPGGPRPAFSICLPTYNRAAMLGAAIRSALAQTRGDFELIVCDNASTDDTRRAAGAVTDPRLRYLRYDRLVGMYANHNRCAEHARADWLVYLHSDDELTPTCLETLGRLIAGANRPPAVVYEFKAYPVYDTVLPDPRAPLVRAPKDTGLAMHFLVTPWVPPSGACYRADFLRRRPFDEHYLDADVLATHLALLDGETVLFTREPLVRKLDHAASCSGHSRQTAIYHFTYARTFRIVTAHPAWPRVQAELRAVVRRYPLYNQGSMVQVLAAAGRWRLARDLLPHIAKQALASRAGLHTLGILLLGGLYWDLLPGYAAVKNKIRGALRRGRRP